MANWEIRRWPCPRRELSAPKGLPRFCEVRAPGERGAAEVRLTLGLSQGELAAILGASRPKVSLALQALAGAGALRREGEALVCDTAMLLRLAEGAEP